MGKNQHTYFASPERASDQELEVEIEFINHSPVLDGLLHSISGLLAILNEQRQIVAINDSFMKMLGIEDPEESLGLRLGEAVECIHSHDEGGGCGTSKYCPTCGAAIAIVSAIDNDKPEERLCALTVKKADKENDIALLVRAQPILIQKKRFILLFLQDITMEEQRAALERTFYHDINNILHGLVGTSELLTLEGNSETAQDLYETSKRLHNEVAIQSCLTEQDPNSYNPLYYEISIAKIFKELKSSYKNHQAAKNKQVIISESIPEQTVKTDISLLPNRTEQLSAFPCQLFNLTDFVLIFI